MTFETYRILIKPKSSTLTPLQADTIFGSLMWTIYYFKGSDYLASLLEEFKTEPPFIISNGFPESYFPRPIYPIPLDEGTIKSLGRENLEKIKKIVYLPEDYFAQIAESLTSENLLNNLHKFASSDHVTTEFFVYEKNFKNTINRLTFTTGDEGSLYLQQEIRFNPDLNWALYIKVNSEKFSSIEELKSLFVFIFEQGFGKRKTTGKGAFDLVSFEKYNLPSAKNPNGFVSLSNFVPDTKDPHKGFYEIFVKYGKLGGEFAKSVAGPWKKPLLMIKEGSTFLTDSIKDYYGKMLPDVHPIKKEVLHYAYAFPVGVRINEEI